MPSSRASSRSRDRTCVSYVSWIGRQVLYHQCHLGSLYAHTHNYFSCFFSHYGLSQDTEYSFLCYIGGLCCLFILQIIVCICQPQTPSLPSPHPLATITLFSMSVSLFLFCRQVHSSHILESTCKRYHMVFVFLFLAYFTQYDNLQVHPWSCKWHYFMLFKSLSNISLYICTTFLYSFIC